VVLAEQVGEGAMPELETSLYSVSLLNDDETPMEFVVHVLEVFFDMDLETAKQKRLLIHRHGTAECLRVNTNIPSDAPLKKRFGHLRLSSILANVRFTPQ
jgi:hypothetical protein